MARIKTYAPGVSFTPADLNSIQDDYENLFSKWRSWPESARYFRIASGSMAIAQYFPSYDGTAVVVTAADASAAFYFNEDDWISEGRGVEFRVRAQVHVNATAVGTSQMAIQIRSAGFISAQYGQMMNSTGNPIGFVDVTTAANTANGHTNVDGAAFELPTSGWYVMVLSLATATTAANHRAQYAAELQYRRT